MKKLLIATTNTGKLSEYKKLLSKLPIKLLTLKDLGLEKTKVEENGRTFKENALKKVKFYSELCGLPTLAEDSGLEIGFLNGEPGVKSRRWPGYEAGDKELIELTLKKLKGVPMAKRGARLIAVIALAIGKKIKTFEGSLPGVILKKPIKKIIPGYPFRSIFYLPKIGKTFGELSPAEEIRIGHRKKALQKALPIIKRYYAGQKNNPNKS